MFGERFFLTGAGRTKAVLRLQSRLSTDENELRSTARVYGVGEDLPDEQERHLQKLRAIHQDSLDRYNRALNSFVLFR